MYLENAWLYFENKDTFKSQLSHREILTPVFLLHFSQAFSTGILHQSLGSPQGAEKKKPPKKLKNAERSSEDVFTLDAMAGTGGVAWDRPPRILGQSITF